MTKKLNILLLTNFDDPSFRAIPAVAHLMAEFQASLTIMHVYEHESDREDAERDLRSFFVEADYYPGSRRIAIQGRLEAVVEQYCEAVNIDLVMAPAGKRLVLPGLTRPSVRARLIERVASPLWTVTTSVNNSEPLGSIRHVGCYVDFEHSNFSHVRVAARFAEQIGAGLRLLCVVPSVNEGTLLQGLDSYRPMHPDVAENRLNDLLTFLRHDARIYVESGEEARELPALIKRSKSDIVFVGQGQALVKGLTGRPKLRSVINRLPCPAVCFDGASRNGARWVLEPRFRDQQAVPQPSLMAINR